jgi:hypothetical protein
VPLRIYRAKLQEAGAKWVPLAVAILVLGCSYRPIIDVASSLTNVMWDDIFRFKDQLDTLIYVVLRLVLMGVVLVGSDLAITKTVRRVRAFQVQRRQPKQLEFSWILPKRRVAYTFCDLRTVRRVRFGIN